MNLSSSFKTKLNVSKAHIIANEIKEEDESAEEQINIIQPARERRTSSIKNTERKRSINSKIKKQQQVNEADLDESSCSEPLNRPRVDRFLSIVEIPPEIIWLTQQAFAKNNAKNESIDEEEEEEPKLDENKTKPTTLITNKKKKPKIKKKQKRKESFNIFKFDYGSSLTQQAKANIIKEIIKNYDLDLFMNELRSRDVVQINLNKKFIFILLLLHNLIFTF
jgi:hypothetical protein